MSYLYCEEEEECSDLEFWSLGQTMIHLFAVVCWLVTVIQFAFISAVDQNATVVVEALCWNEENGAFDLCVGDDVFGLVHIVHPHSPCPRYNYNDPGKQRCA